MNNFNLNKELLIKSATKMLADKKAVIAYIKGETKQDILIQKGIKLAKPL